MNTLGEIDNLLLQNYLNVTHDVRRCPNKGCDAYGFAIIDPDSGLIECSVPFECLKCHHKWTD